MTERQSHSLAWLGELTQFLGLAPDLVIQPVGHEPGIPTLDFGPALPQPEEMHLPTPSDTQDHWRRTLTELLDRREWKLCLINLLGIPVQTLAIERDGARWQDGPAFLTEALWASPPGRIHIVLSPAGLLSENRHAYFRTWIASRHRLEWLVYLGPAAAKLLGVHPTFRMAVLVIHTGVADREKPHLLRLVDLTDIERSEWKKVLLHTAKRSGGEVGPSIVLRNPELDDRPWTYQRFSKRLHEIREDARQLGALKPLGEWVKNFRVGLKRTVGAVDLGEAGTAPEGTVLCFGGRSIQRGGQLGPPVCAVKRDGIPKEMMLRPGDILVRSIAGLSPQHDPLVAARVPEHALPATFDRTCIRLRWRPVVDNQVADLLIGYLNSRHARDWLIAHGVQSTLNPSVLRQLEVPDPSPEVLKALETLSQAEKHYRQWGDEVQGARQELFAAPSYGQQVTALIERQRIEIERLRAAEDSQSLGHQIRNYYPHPIALRRELILQKEHGKDKLDSILECAEYAITLVAVMAMLQVATDHDVGSSLPTSQLRSFCREGSLHLDWGKCLAVVREGAAFTTKHTNPLSLPFPALATLETRFANDSSDWAQSERTLRVQRNNQSHLLHLPDVEIHQMSDDFSRHLDVLLGGVTFLGTTPLVHVLDYQLHPVSGERVATFYFLQGASSAFQRREQMVAGEVPRGIVGFLDHQGAFRSAFPWLMMDTCPVCKRGELFVFNRFENSQVIYVAMETGHPHHPTNLAERMHDLVRNASQQS